MSRWGIALALAFLLGGGLLRADEWGTNYERARKQAADERKPILLDFTGSDWCGWCMKFDAEVFESKGFKDYARENLVLVRLDFPHEKMLPSGEKAQNDALASRYNVHSYPTLLLVSADGKELFRQGGYTPGGPSPFLASLSKASPPLAQQTQSDAMAAFQAGEVAVPPAP